PDPEALTPPAVPKAQSAKSGTRPVRVVESHQEGWTSCTKWTIVPGSLARANWPKIRKPYPVASIMFQTLTRIRSLALTGQPLLAAEKAGPAALVWPGPMLSAHRMARARARPAQTLVLFIRSSGW